MNKHVKVLFPKHFLVNFYFSLLQGEGEEEGREDKLDSLSDNLFIDGILNTDINTTRLALFVDVALLKIIRCF